MKKITLFILLAVFSLAYSKFTLAQTTTTMQDILGTVDKKIVELEETQNQEVVNITLDLLVNTGKKTVTRFLDPAFAYNVMVIGDRRISKIKISIRKKGQTTDWEYVDELSDAKPTLRVEPLAYDQYEFTISVDEFKTGDNVGHFALLLYHKNPERDK